MSLEDLDPLLASPKRLRLLAILHASVWAEFTFLQDSLEITKSDLSKQMKALSDAEYVGSKRSGGRRGGTAWYRITREGRRKYEDHVAALRALTESVPISTDSPD